MATATTATAWTNSSDANFRAWGKWISDTLAAFGWVLVGSSFATGTSWLDVTAPAAANTARVTELWRTNDSLHGSAPLYMLLEYGEGSTADTPALRFRLGTGGSGASLSGQFFDSGTTYFAAGAVNANSMTHYASGSSSRFSFSMCVSGTSWTATNCLGFGIERRVDADGDEQATGWLIYRYSSTSTRGTIAFKQDGTGPSSTFINVMGFAVLLLAESNLTFDSKIAVSPMIFCMGPMEIGLNVVVLPATHLGAGATFTVSIFGTTHTYVTMNDISNMTLLSGSSTAIESAMRYE